MAPARQRRQQSRQAQSQGQLIGQEILEHYNYRGQVMRVMFTAQPYWTVISEGCALGYRRGAIGGTWIGRFRDDAGRQHYEAVGAADDARDPDSLSVFSFAQAQEKSRAFFARKAREMAGDAAPSEGPYRVTDALDDYFKSYAKRGKGVSATLSAANLHIRPALGALSIAKLTTKRLRDWHHAIADTRRPSHVVRSGTARIASISSRVRKCI